MRHGANPVVTQIYSVTWDTVEIKQGWIDVVIYTASSKRLYLHKTYIIEDPNNLSEAADCAWFAQSGRIHHHTLSLMLHLMKGDLPVQRNQVFPGKQMIS